MNTLFSTEDTFSGKLIALSRPLTLGDVNVQYVTSVASPESLRFCTSVRAGRNLTLKQEHVNELISLLGIKVNENGRYIFHSKGLNGLTDRWQSTDLTTYHAYIEESVSYAGLRSEKTKRVRWSERFNETTQKADAQKNTLLQSALDDITADIQKSVEAQNQMVKEDLRKMIVDINIKDIEEFLNDGEKTALSSMNDEEATLQAQIARIRSQLKTKQDDIYTLKRTALTRQALKQLGEQGQAIVNAFADEKRTKETGLTIFK